jgi:hypothetical protein
MYHCEGGVCGEVQVMQNVSQEQSWMKWTFLGNRMRDYRPSGRGRREAHERNTMKKRNSNQMTRL